MEISTAARVRISGGRGAPIERTLEPTPYAAELVAEDVAHAGRGARIEIDAEGVGPSTLALLEASVARFSQRGVPVTWRGVARPVAVAR